MKNQIKKQILSGVSIVIAISVSGEKMPIQSSTIDMHSIASSIETLETNADPIDTSKHVERGIRWLLSRQQENGAASGKEWQLEERLIKIFSYS